MRRRLRALNVNPATNQWEGINVDLLTEVAAMPAQVRARRRHLGDVDSNMTTGKCDFGAGLYIPLLVPSR